jgi:hypothetical protein
MIASKVDVNQPEIVMALRAVGASVQHLHEVGKGCPDLLVVYRKKLYLLEVKAKDGKLTPQQEKWHQNWNGPVYVVRTIDEALVAIGVLK